VGCEGIVNGHQIGFSYTSCDDLKNKLDDERLIGLENNFVSIDKFLKERARLL
jgi:hypothetical protein